MTVQTTTVRPLGRVMPAHIRPDGRAKRQFASRDDALAWLHDRGLTGQTYQCRWCTSWHIAHVRHAPDAAPPRLDADRKARRARDRQVRDRLEARRRARRLAARAFWWQEVQS